MPHWISTFVPSRIQPLAQPSGAFSVVRDSSANITLKRQTYDISWPTNSFSFVSLRCGWYSLWFANLYDLVQHGTTRLARNLTDSSVFKNIFLECKCHIWAANDNFLISRGENVLLPLPLRTLRSKMYVISFFLTAVLDLGSRFSFNSWWTWANLLVIVFLSSVIRDTFILILLSILHFN